MAPNRPQKHITVIKSLVAIILLGFGLINMAIIMNTPGAVSDNYKWYIVIDLLCALAGFRMLSPEDADALVAYVGTYVRMREGRRSGDRDDSEAVSVKKTDLPVDQQIQIETERLAPHTKPVPPTELESEEGKKE